MEVDVSVDWDVAGRAIEVTEGDAASLLEFALKQEGRGGAWTLALRFVGDAEMRSLHEQFMGERSSTDIMTFPYDGDDGEQGGDILISVDTADENARQQGAELADELRFLMLHGLLHILVWDDHDERERQEMLDRQAALLAGWKATAA
ncbi:MAG TPA: rRNA maturation RNase YbeY [Thermomicrobiales bacterium]|nr:rRNA maturation RNase YbeY [Thermomicrobiales bacterium]